jgi:hypothetical protein
MFEIRTQPRNGMVDLRNRDGELGEDRFEFLFSRMSGSFLWSQPHLSQPTGTQYLRLRQAEFLSEKYCALSLASYHLP